MFFSIDGMRMNGFLLFKCFQREEKRNAPSCFQLVSSVEICESVSLDVLFEMVDQK